MIINDLIFQKIDFSKILLQIKSVKTKIYK